MAYLSFLHVVAVVEGRKLTEYKIDADEEARSRMAQRANGRRSVPQILLMVSTKVDVMTCIG